MISPPKLHTSFSIYFDLPPFRWRNRVGLLLADIPIMIPSLAILIAATLLAITPGAGIAYVVARTVAGQMRVFH